MIWFVLGLAILNTLWLMRLSNVIASMMPQHPSQEDKLALLAQRLNSLPPHLRQQAQYFLQQHNYSPKQTDYTHLLNMGTGNYDGVTPLPRPKNALDDWLIQDGQD